MKRREFLGAVAVTLVAPSLPIPVITEKTGIRGSRAKYIYMAGVWWVRGSIQYSWDDLTKTLIPCTGQRNGRKGKTN